MKDASTRMLTALSNFGKIQVEFSEAFLMAFEEQGFDWGQTQKWFASLLVENFGADEAKRIKRELKSRISRAKKHISEVYPDKVSMDTNKARGVSKTPYEKIMALLPKLESEERMKLIEELNK